MRSESRIWNSTAATVAALLLAGCSGADTGSPTGPALNVEPSAARVAPADGENGFRPINLGSPIPGLNSEAYDVNIGNRSAGVVYSAGQFTDGQAIVWESPSLGGGNVIGRPAGFAAAVGYGLTDAGLVAVTAYEPGTRAYVWVPGQGFIPIPVPANTVVSEAKDISNTNIVVGSFVRGGVRRAYRASVIGGFENLHPAAAFDASGAEGVTDNGTVTGWVRYGTTIRAVRWNPNGTLVFVGPVGGQTAGHDVNANGDVGGTSTFPGTSVQIGFIHRLNSYPQPLPLPNTSVRGISDLGRMVGTMLGDQPATFRNVNLSVQLGLPLGASSGRASGVNRCGHAVGAVYSAGGSQATFWQRNACD